MKILVTGGLGFIGSNFIKYILSETDNEVVNIDKCDYMAREKNAPEQARYNSYWLGYPGTQSPGI